MNTTKQNKSISARKTIQENVVLLNWKAHAKIQAILKEKKFNLKKSLTSLLHQAIQLLNSVGGIGLSVGQEHWVVFLSKILNSSNTSLYLGV